MARLGESRRRQSILIIVRGAISGVFYPVFRRIFPPIAAAFTVSLWMLFTGEQLALAADWRYCLAPSYAERKIYMTDAFPVRGAPYDADNVFEQTLDEAGLHHDVVQCPRADDESSISAMEQHAITFNREVGNVIVHIRLDPMRKQ